MTKDCLQCGKSFWAHHRHNRWCSQDCAHAPKKVDRITKLCGICAKQFLTLPNRIRRFCSRKCSSKNLSIIHKGKRLWKNRTIKPLANFVCERCGKECKIAAPRITYGEGRFCSRSCSAKANAMYGESNPTWAGGVTPERKRIRESSEYKHWRKEVFERDNYTCVQCKVRGGALHADHIKPFAYFPELRTSLENGRTLCRPCHLGTDTYGLKIRGAIPICA